MQTDSSIRLIYIPCGSEDEASEIARALLADELIACGNIYRSRSLYQWEGSLADEIEYVLVCKTSEEAAPAAEARAKELHSYEVPCILRLAPENVNREYAQWVRGQLERSSATVNRERQA